MRFWGVRRAFDRGLTGSARKRLGLGEWAPVLFGGEQFMVAFSGGSGDNAMGAPPRAPPPTPGPAPNAAATLPRARRPASARSCWASWPTATQWASPTETSSRWVGVAGWLGWVAGRRTGARASPRGAPAATGCARPGAQSPHPQTTCSPPKSPDPPRTLKTKPLPQRKTSYSPETPTAGSSRWGLGAAAGPRGFDTS